jgi:hypothetical protein
MMVLYMHFQVSIEGISLGTSVLRATVFLRFAEVTGAMLFQFRFHGKSISTKFTDEGSDPTMN